MSFSSLTLSPGSIVVHLHYSCPPIYIPTEIAFARKHIMDTILGTPSSPFAITDGFAEKGETRITMHCHDRIFQKVTVLNEVGETLFTTESKGMASWSFRRTIKDASGSPIFDLRKILDNPIRYKWVVESPSGDEMCCVRHISFRHRHALDVVVKNEKDKDKEVVMEVRPKDQGALTTLVNIGGIPAVEIQMTEVNLSQGRDRSVWRARIAGGVDLALVSISILLYSYDTKFTA